MYFFEKKRRKIIKIMSKEIIKVVESKEQGEGNGARVRRSIGSREVSMINKKKTSNIKIKLKK